MLRLLHTADWHLGRRFRNFGDDLKLTRARLDAVDRLLLAAERNRVDAILCAGDLFDEPSPGEEWWRELAELLKRRSAPSRPIFLFPGNHDPLLPDSVWARGSRFRALLPASVHVVDREDFQHPLGEGGVLYAVPCLSRAGQRDPTELIPVREPGDERIRVGMVHGSTFDMADRQTNFPIDADAALLRGLDYLAIGDTHGFRFVPPDRQLPPTVYPGTPEPTAFDEKEPGQVALVFFNRQRRALVRPERVATWTWEERRVTSLDELVELRGRSDLDRCVLRLCVEMTLAAPDYERAERLLEDLAGTSAKHGRAGLLELDRTRLSLDTTTIERHCAELPESLRSAVRRLKAEAAQPGRAHVAQRALYHLYRASRSAS